MRDDFPQYFKKKIRERNETGQKGCVIFDDLMSELADCGILVDLFTKYSSHYNISTVHITQNVFFKSGKRSSDNVTVYRNCHVLVLFKHVMDRTVLSTIARRICSGAYSDALSMINYVVDTYRYIVIFGDLERPSELRFASDIFAEDPVPHQRIFELADKKSKCSLVKTLPEN